MLEILGEELDLAVERTPNLGRGQPTAWRSADGTAAASRTLGTLPPLRLPSNALVEVGEKPGRRIERADDPSFFHFAEGARELTINDALWTERDFISLGDGLEEVADGDARFLADRDRQGHLVFLFDLDQWHDGFSYGHGMDDV